MRIECTESVVVNNIIGSFIKQQPTIENWCTFSEYLIRELYTVTLREETHSNSGYTTNPTNHQKCY